MLITAKNVNFLDIIKYPQIDIEENIFTFITGESGCGKSTFLKILNRVIIPNRGEITYKGENISAKEVIAYRKEVMLISQEVFLLDKSIEDNFKFYYESREDSLISSSDMKKFLGICCIDTALDTPCTNLSGGEKQRVFLAICLSFCPKVLLLDEPTSALDEKTSKTLLSNVKQFCFSHSITPISICHNDILVQEFADKIIHLNKGEKS